MGRARAMLIQAGLEAKYKEELWCEVISTATKLDNIMVRPGRTKPPHTLFYGEDAKYARSLRTFGEMAVVAIHEGKKMRSKLDNRGKTCMFVGYADDHTKDVYRFLNIHTKRIILSRDVRWLNVMWKRYKKKSIYARSRVELFLDEEESSLEDDKSFGELSIKEMMEASDDDGNNIETAFLYGDIEEEIFMKSPIGMEEVDPGSSPEDCYQLKKGIYGLCHAARQFWKKFVDTIKQESFGFQVSPADPCVLFKEDKLGICIIIMYVDDMLIIGKKEQIDDFASKIQKVFSVKIQHNLADYLGCEFYMNKERTRGWLGQPSIIKSLEQKFGERAMKERLSLTPGTPRFTAIRIEDPEDKVNPQDHEIYRSGVGTLLYLTKHSRPDICNPVRELSKTMDAPAPAHLKEMYKLIRHVLATKGYGLKFELRKDIMKWALKALSDNDFASDKETRISVFGYIIYFCGIPIAWRSKGMKSVVLSTTEAEYMALSEVVKELKFIVQLLQTMNIEVELPITVHVDNVGAIWLSNNRTTSDRTKHIDIRTSFVKEYQEDGKIIIKFVKSEENETDIFTKNTTNVIFNNHQKKLLWDKTNVDNEVSQEPDQSENQQEGC